MKEIFREVRKVLVAGPVGVGKTTAVQSVSDVPVLTTEAQPTDETRLHKPTTTVAMDFGVVQLNRSQTIHIYGTPGPEALRLHVGHSPGGQCRGRSCSPTAAPMNFDELTQLPRCLHDHG